MGKQTRNILKGYFETGKKPVGANYVDLLDSYLLVNGENTGSIDIQGSITASGDISASGIIYANTFQSPGSTEIGVSDSLNVTGGITASNISSSGFVSASHFSGDGKGLTNITASSLEIQQITASYISGSIQASGSLRYTSGSTDVLYAIQVSGSIIPDSTNAWDLGGPDHVWRDLWLSEDSMRFVSSSGEITRFTQEDAKRLREGKPSLLAADDAISGFTSVLRPEAIMSALNTTDYQKWTVEGRIGTFLGGNLIHDMNFNGGNNYITLGKSDGSSTINLIGNVSASGRVSASSGFEADGGTTSIFGIISASGDISSSGRIRASGGFETDNSASFGHISASGDLKVDGFASFGSFGNIQTMISTTAVPANYNTVLYGPVTVGANAIFDIAVDAQVLVKDLSNA